MSAADAYGASSGWSGGSALNAGGVLSNYYQKLQSVDPSSGSLTVAQPTQASTQPSSLSRVAVTTPASTQTASPTIASTTSTDPTQAAATAAANATANAVSTSNLSGGLNGLGAQAATPVSHSLAAATSPAAASVAPITPYSGPANIKQTLANGAVINLVWDNTKGTYVIADGYKQAGGYLVPDKTSPTGYSDMSTMIATGQAPAEAAAVQQAVAQANSQYTSQISAYQSAQTLYQQQTQQAQAQAAQLAADEATKFDLSAKLQAPNTTDGDASRANDLARVVSQYAGGLGGADAAAYGYAGQGAQATQAAVNQVAHNTAYANAFNSNYSTFANALTAQQTADANASGQKLNLDMQGISDALSVLEQQGSQLSSGAQTQLQSQLIPLKNLLAQYANATDQYKVSSDASAKIAQAIFTAASGLATGGVTL